MLFYTCFPVFCLIGVAFSVFQSQKGEEETTWLPESLRESGSPGQLLWKNQIVKDSDASRQMPNTGVTRHYDFQVSRKSLAPDGYTKNLLVANGQFPGPLIEANWGDFIEVVVSNNISDPEEGTGIHWHGLLQNDTPWFDGVPGIHECPIPPGSSFTYRFRADLYGTSWYHSHFGAQFSGGLFGPMIIHGPSHVDFDIDLGPILLSDYYHKDYHQIVEEVGGADDTKWLQYSDNNLINGRMSYDCSRAEDTRPCSNNAPLTKFKFEPGKSYKLRLINPGSAGQQVFSIDDHDLTVIANDFVPVKPYTTKTVFLGAGQRSDVVVKAAGDANRAYWMRSNISTICNLPRQPQALAVVYYDKADTAKQPQTLPWAYTDNGKCNNDDLTRTVPFYPMTPEPHPAQTLEVVVDQKTNGEGQNEWRLNQQIFRPDYERPLLSIAHGEHQTYQPEWNVVQTGGRKTIRLIVFNNSTISHPMHLHGHNMYILHDGDGPWDGHTLTNPHNPQRRDVQMLRPSGHLVIQYDADNAGVWPFHCHIAWHLSLGLAMNIIENETGISQIVLPPIVQDNCSKWRKFAARGVDRK